VFTRLKEGTDRVAAAAAKQQLADLDTLQKYGVRPQREGKRVSSRRGERPLGWEWTDGEGAQGKATQDQDEDADAAPKLAPVKPGTTGPVQFLKGKIVSSDCSRTPEQR